MRDFHEWVIIINFWRRSRLQGFSSLLNCLVNDGKFSTRILQTHFHILNKYEVQDRIYAHVSVTSVTWQSLALSGMKEPI